MTARVQTAEFTDAMRHGERALAEGRHAAAAAAFARASELTPQAAEPAFSYCLALLGSGDPKAGSALQDLLTRFPDHAAGWDDIGQVLLKAGKAEAGLLCLRRAVSAQPTVPRLLDYGSALRGAGRFAEARAAFAEACRLEPHAVRPAFLLGLCAQDAHDYAGARLAYQRALAIDATLPEAWVNLGIVLQAMGNLPEAKQAYGQALAARADSFGRISQALSGAPKGELWLDLGRLRRSLRA